MAIRFDDAARTVSLSVRDLAADGAASGHLALPVVRSRAARAEAGRRVHTAWQLERADQSVGYRAELTVRRTLAVGDWTVQLLGRVDGVDEEGGRRVVEEIKSTPLDAGRLYRTRAEDWPAWLAQLEIYLWMLHDQAPGDAPPLGRLVLVSLADGSRHVIGVALDADAVEVRIRGQLGAIVAARDRHLAWLAARRPRTVPLPHAGWRDGQREIAEAVEWGLEAGHAVLVQAPTGLGKTDAALVGALALALRTDRQLFWATARNTQQAGVLRAAQRLRAAGLPLRVVQLGAPSGCASTASSTAADACRYAEGYFERLAASPGSSPRWATPRRPSRRGSARCSAEAAQAVPVRARRGAGRPGGPGGGGLQPRAGPVGAARDPRRGAGPVDRRRGRGAPARGPRPRLDLAGDRGSRGARSGAAYRPRGRRSPFVRLAERAEALVVAASQGRGPPGRRPGRRRAARGGAARARTGRRRRGHRLRAAARRPARAAGRRAPAGPVARAGAPDPAPVGGLADRDDRTVAVARGARRRASQPVPRPEPLARGAPQAPWRLRQARRRCFIRNYRTCWGSTPSGPTWSGELAVPGRAAAEGRRGPARVDGVQGP
ncbi:MAG: PD-(D/E)XK nuclease family protein [Myxococcota bacterium]